MGGYNGPAHVSQTSFEYTSTQSIFTFDVAGKVTLTATFLSPVHPDDLLLQSLQFSYLQLSVASADGNAHNVQVYSDVSGEWASPDLAQTLDWGNGVNGGCAYHRFALANPVELSENADMAIWGEWLFGTDHRTGVSSVRWPRFCETTRQRIDNFRRRTRPANPMSLPDNSLSTTAPWTTRRAPLSVPSPTRGKSYIQDPKSNIQDPRSRHTLTHQGPFLRLQSILAPSLLMHSKSCIRLVLPKKRSSASRATATALRNLMACGRPITTSRKTPLRLSMQTGTKSFTTP